MDNQYPDKHFSKLILAQNLNFLMSDHGMNMTDLSRKSGVTDRNISKILKTHTAAGLETIDKLAAALDVQTWQLLTPGFAASMSNAALLDQLVSIYLELARQQKGELVSFARKLSSTPN